MEYKLMEYIYNNSRNECLSELRKPDVLRYSMNMILNISEDEFTLDDWKYTYQYITGKIIEVNTIKDVKQALKEWTHMAFTMK